MIKKSTTVNPSMLIADKEFDDDFHGVLMGWCKEVLDQFLTSPCYASWINKKKGIAGLFIDGFVNYAYGYHLAKPFHYNASLVEKVCLHILPRKMSTAAKDFKEVGPVLSPFFECCETEGYLRSTNSIINRLKKIENKVYEKAKNPANWGVAKSFLQGYFTKI